MDNENLIENLVIIIKQNIADIRNFILFSDRYKQDNYIKFKDLIDKTIISIENVKNIFEATNDSNFNHIFPYTKLITILNYLIMIFDGNFNNKKMCDIGEECCNEFIWSLNCFEIIFNSFK